MKKCLMSLLLLAPVVLSAQTIRGTVHNDKGEPLIGANVYWLESQKGVYSGNEGAFEIPFRKGQEKRLVASYVGHTSDTIAPASQDFVQFRLPESQTLGEVLVQGYREGVLISGLNAIKTEQITQTELKKAACCDLAGCFETQASVQPQTTNVLTNSKELRILGLSGVYNQVLVDGFPMVQGLSYTYGISGIPGALVDNIYVAKGANSVLQGFESISGQINVETLDPEHDKRLRLNLYMNRFKETHLNANYTIKRKKWGSLAAVHVVQPAGRFDRDGDAFLDLPRLSRYMLFNKWTYGKESNWGWNSTIGLRYLREHRLGGQLPFNARTDQGSSEVYGQLVRFDQPEFWAKTGYRFNDQHNLVVYVSGFQHAQNSFFGSAHYVARQQNFYVNAQYEWSYGDHTLKTGASTRYLDLEEDIRFTAPLPVRSFAGNYRKTERIPGWFAENTLRLLKGNLTWIAGIRLDHHDRFGAKATPRMLVKYDLGPRTVLRANIGTGWRTANILSEHVGILSSSRDLVFEEELLPEKALNMGINLTRNFESPRAGLSGYFSADFYRTGFKNQIFPDYDSHPTRAIIRNFTGSSQSTGFQADLSLTIRGRLQVKTGYNFLDVYRSTETGRQTLPFNPKHKLLATLGYGFWKDKLRFDANAHWYGKQRLPETSQNPLAFQRPSFSAPFSVFNLQATYNLSAFSIYAGCENLFDFRQKRPILGWQDPFGPFFDTSFVWGPTRGRELYLGFRWDLNPNAPSGK
ncbi:MAG: TonB-dependent receptor [Saprospiraceae bacterium]